MAGKPSHDVVDDLLARLAAVLGDDVLPQSLQQQIETDVRADWAGQVYVQSKPTSKAKQMIADWRKGDDLSTVALRYGVSERRARQIINQRKRYGSD